jgi:ribosomal protein S18 acetylase RimI-like enzyme
MGITVREFTTGDYEAAYALWKASEGIGLSEADTRENIGLYLRRNPGQSFVALENGVLVGAVLCGNDGRRGFLHHLAVAPSCRRKGAGRALIRKALDALAAQGMRKCHIFVISANEEGKRFWRRVGWEERTMLVVMSKDVTDAAAPAAAGTSA